MADELTRAADEQKTDEQKANEQKRHRRELAQKLVYGICFAAAVILTAALATRHPSFFESVPARDPAPAEHEKEYPARWVYIVAPVLLLALSIFRVRGRQAKESRISVSVLSLSLSLFATILFCILFGVLLSTPEELEQTLVYILGFAALIIGGQHLVEFEEAQHAVNKVSGRVEHTSTTLDTLLPLFDESIKRLTHTQSPRQYRDLVNRAYAGARRRVLGATNHWPIDPGFWTPRLAGAGDLDELDGFWEDQEVCQNLRHAIDETRRHDPLRIVFVGRLNVSLPGASPALSADDFTLFLGVLWRLALAHRLREAMRMGGATDAYLEGSYVRVMVADVPINCHVVDDQAFLLLHLPSEEGGHSYGLEVPTGSGAAVRDQDGARPSIADTYAEIIDRYTRTHVRSAREYAASLLVLAATALPGKFFTDTILVQDGVPQRANVKELLNTLGMQRWIDRQYESKPHVHMVPQLSRDALEAGAVLLACDFLKHYYRRDKICELPERRSSQMEAWYRATVSVDLLIEDLI